MLQSEAIMLLLLKCSINSSSTHLFIVVGCWFESLPSLQSLLKEYSPSPVLQPPINIDIHVIHYISLSSSSLISQRHFSHESLSVQKESKITETVNSFLHFCSLGLVNGGLRSEHYIIIISQSTFRLAFDKKKQM
jgi:hypothetical protein